MLNSLGKSVFFGIIAMGLSGAAISSQESVNNNQHKIFTLKAIQWTDGPDSLPKGAKLAVLEGDLSKAEPFTIRLKLPANYVIPPHWHPIIEHVTVLSGDLYLGMGDKIDKTNVDKLSTGSFAYMQPKMHHFAYTEGESVIQLHGNGPWGIHYINPEDDPRNKKTKETM